jgi:hypothetical protein
MKRVLSHPRFAAGTVAVLALITVAAILIKPPTARAFTLINFTGFFFDPISVNVSHTLHVNVSNHLGPGPLVIRGTCKPTPTGVGSSVPFGPVTLNSGDGIDVPIPWASFAAPDRIPVVCTVAVLPSGGGTVPFDFSARIASSVEIVDDKTNLPTANISSRHILLASGPCIVCD